MARFTWIRWRALAPLMVMLVVGGVLWYLLLDRIVARSIEAVGTALVGAKVDVESADVRLGEGFVSVRGLAVTNPNAPMTNLFEASEITADLRMRPLLERKVFIDTLAFRGLAFNTDREESGAVEEPSEASRAVRRQLDAWADQVTVPPFSVEGLTDAVDVDALTPDSLQTPRAVIQLGERLQGRQDALTQALSSADPTPVITEGRELLDSLRGKSLRDLGLQGTTSAVRQLRDLVSQLGDRTDVLAALDDSVSSLGAEGSALTQALADARAQDMAYARGLLRLPSLDGPDMTPSLLGDFAVDRVKRLLYWVNLAERYVPPGLDPRRRPGPRRARMAGTNIEFPSPNDYPGFTLAFAEAGVRLDDGPAAGDYSLQLQNLTSAPAALGLPLRFVASRVAGQGRSDVGVAALFDHTGDAVRDSLSLRLDGVSLPSIAIPGLGTTLQLSRGTSDVGFVRTGDSVNGRIMWTSRNADWVPGGNVTGVVSELRTVVQGIDEVNLEVRFTGHVLSPRLSVQSNVGQVVAGAVRERLREEVERAEGLIRAELDRRVEQPLAAYQSRLTEVRSELTDRVAGYQGQVTQLRADLEARIRELTRGLPIGR